MAMKGYSQETRSPFMIWRLLSISGEARVRGSYREFEYARDNSNSITQKNYYANGMLHVNTNSFIIHPNFMLLNVSGTYNPITRKNKYIGIPDYSENYYSEGIDASTVLFSQKRINLKGNVIINNSIQNIENITRIQTKNKQLGAGISYRSNILPITVIYSKQNVEQKVLGSDSQFDFEQKLLQASTGGSFSPYDRLYFSYLHTENKGSDNTSQFPLQPNGSVNIIDEFELNNEIAFDSLKNYTFYSTIINSAERGTVSFKRLYARENLTLKLPKKLLFAANYNLGVSELDSNKMKYQGIQVSLSHQLYQSLFSKIVYEHNQTSQSNYEDERNKYGFDLRYVKLIPKGKLTLLYSYYREYQKVLTAPTTVGRYREEYKIIDTEIILFKSQNVELPSVVVRDITGMIVYQLNIDYTLIEHGTYLEIIRVPGGLIANGSTVYIDYRALQPGKYDFYMNNYSFSADVLLYDNKLNIYYRSDSQNYNIQNKSENLALNYYNRYIIGTRLDFNYAKGGVEYESYYSTILPYRAIRYSLEFQKMVKRVTFTLNGNLQYVQMAGEIDRRKDFDVSSKIAYSIFSNVKLNFDYMYRSIKGRGIDLEMTTSKLEITTELHRLFISMGAEFYRNKEVNSKLQFKGVYVQLTRNF